MTKKNLEAANEISTEAQAISDIEKLRILDETKKNAGFNDEAARMAVVDHMNDMCISAEANLTEYMGALYRHAPEVGDRLEEAHFHAAAERQFKKERGVLPKSLTKIKATTSR